MGLSYNWVVVPVKIIHASSLIEAFEANTKKEGTKFTIDLIEEVRDEGNVRILEYQK